jgi:Ni/Co efflux regulator RcnB
MNKHTLIAAALTALVFSASPALADKDKKGGPPAHAKSHKVDGHDQGLHLGWYKQDWKRGDRIVWAEVEPHYYVEDYRVYRLSPPPAGYRWVRPMDDRYLLVEIATGVIAQALGY